MTDFLGTKFSDPALKSMRWGYLASMVFLTFFLCDKSALGDAAAESELTVEVPKIRSLKVQLETAMVWQSRNEFRLPGSSGSTVNLSDYTGGPAFGVRLSGEWKINDRHGLRLLIAPLAFDVSYTPNQPLSVMGRTFAAGTPVTTRYKFNSYRLTYRYFFESTGPWLFRIGATAKIRDANISTTDGNMTADDPNVGFVPLLHLGVRRNFGEGWFADFDADALAAPQGRAEDVSLRAGYDMTPWEFSLGYRFLEGGADNEKVFTFAFLHYAFASFAFYF